MIPDDNITNLQRLERHQPKAGRSWGLLAWPWIVAALLFFFFDFLYGLGARLEPFFYSCF